MNDVIILITGKNCPNCRGLKAYLSKREVEYREVKEGSEEFENLQKAHKFKSVPVLIDNDRVLFDCNAGDVSWWLRNDKEGVQ